MVVAVLTFLFIDIFDTIGTLLGVSHRADMVDEDGNVKNLNQAFMADAVGTIGAHRSQDTVEYCVRITKDSPDGPVEVCRSKVVFV